jgi:ATP-dependent RNA helicase RhlE
MWFVAVVIFGGVNINTKQRYGLRHSCRNTWRIMDLTLDNVIRFEEMQKLVIDEFDVEGFVLS